MEHPYGMYPGFETKLLNKIREYLTRRSAEKWIGHILTAGIFAAGRNRIHARAENLQDAVMQNDNDQVRTVSFQAARMLDTYGNAILRLVYSYLHNMSDAEDILQETLIRYMQNNPALESPEHEKAWLLTAAANLSKNRIRSNILRSADELNEELAAEEREDLSFVWSAVKALPEKYREVIHLYYYEGYPTKQIAEILNRKESTVRSDLKRGREKLKDILKGGYDFEL